MTASPVNRCPKRTTEQTHRLSHERLIGVKPDQARAASCRAFIKSRRVVDAQGPTRTIRVGSGFRYYVFASDTTCGGEPSCENASVATSDANVSESNRS
jgi:hypothetical protein